VANYFIKFCITTGLTERRGSQLLSAAQGIYAGMRFLAGFAMMLPWVQPRYILLAFLLLCFVFAIAAMNTTGATSIGLLMMVFAFESACFATIFTLSLRGLGRHTKRGGSLLVAAISGGMVFPPAMGAVVDSRGPHFAMIIPAMGYVIAWTYPVYVNFWNAEVMDLHRASDLNVGVREKEKELERQVTEEEKGRDLRVEEVR
jgi:FHS family L-fucose permease-like MFS transporter